MGTSEDSIKALEERISLLETQVEKSSSSKSRFELAETSFKTVLDCDVHEDNKASRILTAIAFLTAATAATFNLYNSFFVKDLQKPDIFGLDLGLFAFSLYMFFIILGVVLYLTALGPSLNVRSWLRGNSDNITSLLFFDAIARVKEEKWSNYWLNQESENLQNEMAKNLIHESYLIAEKVKIKYSRMAIGSFFFKIAIAFLIPLIVSLFPSEPKYIYVFSLLGEILLFGLLAFEAWIRPSQKLRHSIFFWVIFAICLICLVVLILKL